MALQFTLNDVSETTPVSENFREHHATYSYQSDSAREVNEENWTCLTLWYLLRSPASERVK